MITPAFTASALLFVALLVVARIVFDRARTPSGGTRYDRVGAMVLVLVGAGALMLRTLLVGGASGSAAIAVAMAVAFLGAIVGLLIGPFVAEILGTALGRHLMGAPSDRAIKDVKTFDRARSLALKGKLEEAAAEYAAEMAKDPAQPHGYKEWADVLDKLGRLEEAAGILLRSVPHIEDIEQRALVRLRVVDLHRQVGNIDVARSLLEEMLKELWPPRIERAIRSRREHLPP